jgi:hypothetical protein
MGIDEGERIYRFHLRLEFTCFNFSLLHLQEILLTRASSRTHENDRKMILYLSKCSCGESFCMERASLAVQACLKRIKVEDCATESSIQYVSCILYQLFMILWCYALSEVLLNHAFICYSK